MSESLRHHYAMYLQATRKHPGTGKTMRRQWVAFPPLDGWVAERAGVDPDPRMLKFWREQSAPENRVKWRHVFEMPDELDRKLTIELSNLENANANNPPESQWVISPVITAQVLPAELAKIVKEPETPYAVLRRFEKVAKAVHNIAI